MRLTDVLALIMAWWITFTVVLVLVSALGFNPVGVGAGMTFLANKLQSLSFSNIVLLERMSDS